MTWPARLSPQARREIEKAQRDMHHVATQKALRAAVENLLRRLGANPLLGSTRRYLPDRYRCWPLTRFGYLVVYDPRTNPVEILRFVHMKRDLPRVLAELRDA